MIFILFAALWLISPPILLVLYIVQTNKTNRIQKMYDELMAEIRGKNAQDRQVSSASEEAEADSSDINSAENENVSSGGESANAAENTFAPRPAADNVKTAPPDAPKPAQKSSPYDMPYYKQSAPAGAPAPASPAYDMSYSAENAAVSAKAAYTAKKTAAETPKKVSSMNIMLILGALFIIISGLIFATTTWEFLPNGIRAAVILSFSAIFFAVSSLAERKLGLEKTGMLFYVLGSVFLPTTLIAAGYFKVFGEWFSLSGNGRPLLLALSFAALSAVCFKGSLDYKNAVFAWTALLSFSAAVCSLIWQFTGDIAVFSLAASIYGLAVIFAAQAITKNADPENSSVLLEHLNNFAAANTVILSIFPLISAFSGENRMINFISCIIFSAGYLKNTFTEKNGFAGAVPFTVFMTCGFFTLLLPKDFGGIAGTVIAASAVPAVLSLMNIIPLNLKNALKYISVFFASAALLISGISAFTAEVSWLLFASYMLLAAEMLALGIMHKGRGGRVMISVFPAACSAAALMLSRLVFEGKYPQFSDMLVPLLWLALTAAMQTVFILLKKPALRTHFSDGIFAGAAIAAGIIVLAQRCVLFEFGEDNYGFSEIFLYRRNIIQFAALLLTAAALILPAVFTKFREKRYIFTVSAFLWCGTAVLPLARLLKNISALSETRQSMSAAFAAVTALLIAASMITQLKSKSGLGAVTAISVRAAAGIYIISLIAAEGFVSLLLALLAVFSVMRFIKNKSKPEFISAIILFILAAGKGSAEIFADVHFEHSLLFMCGAAALVYVASLLIGSENSFAYIAEIISRYIIGALTSVCMIYIASETEPPVYIVMTALFFLMTATAFCNVRSTAFLAVPLSLFYFDVSFIAERYSGGIMLTERSGIYEVFHPVNISILAAIAASAALSFILHRNALWEKDGKKLYIDMFAFTRFIGIAAYYRASEDNTYAVWCVIPLFALCLLSMSRKSLPETARKWIYTVCAFAPAAMWITQPFIEIPEIIRLELKILPILLYCALLRILWKDKPDAVGLVTFIVYALSYVTLFIDALTTGEIADGLIIVISSLLILIFSFMIKKKKWFLLSVTVLVVSTLFMSRGFWASLAWWVYLLAAGIILIAVGAANEMKKQAAAKQEKSGLEEKITRFMSEWTW